MTPNIMEVKRCLLKLGHDIRFEEIVKVMKEYGYEIKQPKVKADQVIIHLSNLDVIVL